LTLTKRAAELRNSKLGMLERLTEMDEEKMKRQMEFIVEQQAQFAAKIGQLEDTAKRTGENVERLGENVERLGENVERLGGVVEQLGGVVEQLVGIVERIAESVTRLVQVTTERFEAVDNRADETDRKLAALVDAQMRSEESFRKMSEGIDNLAATVDRHIAEGHNGRARPEG
jgi:chromosome segregation ATPase